jgi:hypothetical protein
MKKIIAILVAIGMVAAIGQIVGADDSQDITITIEDYATASILLNETIWVTTAPLNDQETKLLNIDNNGAVALDIEIKAGNTTNWDIETSPGNDDYALRYNTTVGAILGEDEITWQNSTFYSSLAHDGDVDFALTLLMPTSSSVSAAQEITVTFTATAN